MTANSEPVRLEFSCTGTPGSKMRVELDARMESPSQTRFAVAADEGPNLGGDGSAPTPLHLFISALTACLVTQLRNFAKRMEVRIDDMRIDVRADWLYEVRGRIYETRPDGIEVDVFIDSPDSEGTLSELVAAARKGCFIEQTLSVPNHVTHRIKTAEGWKRL